MGRDLIEGHNSVNPFDYLLITVIVFSGTLGLKRGFVREAMGLLGWGASLAIASRFAGRIAEVLSRWVAERQGALGGLPLNVGGVAIGTGAFLLLLLLSLMAMTLLGRSINSLVTWVGLSPADRTLGLGFGLARGVLVILVGFLVFMLFDIPEPGWMHSSRLTPWVDMGLGYITLWLPHDFPSLGRLAARVIAGQ